MYLWEGDRDRKEENAMVIGNILALVWAVGSEVFIILFSMHTYIKYSKIKDGLQCL